MEILTVHACSEQDGCYASLPQAQEDQEDQVDLQFQLFLWVQVDPVNNNINS